MLVYPKPFYIYTFESNFSINLSSNYGFLCQVVFLMGTDLLRQQQKWKGSLSEIRQLMASLIQEGFNSSHMVPWRLHWDHQLYKALEHQYQLGLEALNEHLPEIRVELTYRYIHVCEQHHNDHIDIEYENIN